ncbi:MAG: 1-acyl-sn-glycerol-3-phosphate acyltransferase [Oscillospiraceae bacterium]|nr:1-acyl-sn-glycerol-3-phosphate acyltransferase [Oscillospiraceae bacterium]
MADKFKYDYSSFHNFKMMNTIRPLCNFLCKTKYNIEFRGQENLDRKGGFIIAANHISALDPMFIAMASKRLFHYIAKEELFENPVMAKAIVHLNAFPIRRGIGDMKAVNYGIELVRRGEVLCIFPEGTRSPDGTPKTAKSGVGYIARATRADVVPVAIFKEKNEKGGSKVIINIGEVIPNSSLGFTENGKSKENKAAAKMIMDTITALWEECR